MSKINTHGLVKDGDRLSNLKSKEKYQTHSFYFYSILISFFIALSYLWYSNIDLTFSSKYSVSQAIGQYFGIISQGLIIVIIFLAARPKSVEKYLGLDKLLTYHRWAAELLILTIIIHISSEVFATSDLGVMSSVMNYSGKLPYFALATVGTSLLFLISILSLKRIRRKFNYETWYFIHLLSYLAMVMVFFHEYTSGIDFSSKGSRLQIFWITLNVASLIFLMFNRTKSILKSTINPYKVIDIIPHGNSAKEVILKGKPLSSSHGQFAIFRFLTKKLFWQTHPFSIGNNPMAGYIRLTIRNLGDGTQTIFSDLKIGDYVLAEGPYGSITNEYIGNSKVALIAGGVGIVPILSLLQSLSSVNEPAVIYRSRDLSESPHLEEITQLAQGANGRIIPIIGSTNRFLKNPFSPESIKEMIPDITDREVILCGPELMIDRVVLSLIKLGVKSSNIHHERLWW